MKLAIQTFSLRAFPPLEAIKMVAELGVKYIEPHWPHAEVTDEVIAAIADAGLTSVAYGVPTVQLNWMETKASMQCAQRLGVPVVNVDVESGAWPLLHRCALDFGLKLAIHPHGPGHRYSGWRSVWEMVYVGSPVGICYDTGHIARAGDDVLAGVYAMPMDTILSFHLKDVDDEGRDVPVGMGVLPLRPIFHKLRESQWAGPMVLEWEGSERDPMPGLRIGVEFVQDALNMVSAEQEGMDLL